MPYVTSNVNAITKDTTKLTQKRLHKVIHNETFAFSPTYARRKSQRRVLPYLLQTLTNPYRRISETSLRKLLLRGRVESGVAIGFTAHPGDSKKYEHPPHTPCAILKNFVTCSRKSICVYEPLRS